MCMSSTLFSTKSKIQRVLYILLAILSLLSLGYAVYHYYPIYFSAKEMGTLHGTKYEFLERFYVKTEEGKDVYVIDGIIYNTTPFCVPVTLKSISPRKSSIPCMSDKIAIFLLPSASSLDTRPMAIPATGALMGTP